MESYREVGWIGVFEVSVIREESDHLYGGHYGHEESCAWQLNASGYIGGENAMLNTVEKRMREDDVDKVSKSQDAREWTRCTHSGFPKVDLARQN